MAFFAANMRGKYPGANMVKCARLAIGLLETCRSKTRNAKGPEIEEFRIPRAMGKWSPSMAHISGISPDQGVVNFFAIEMAIGKQEDPKYTPFVTGESGRPAVCPMVPLRPLLFPRPRTMGGNATDPQKTNRPDHVIPVIRVKLHSIRPCRGAVRGVGALVAVFPPFGPTSARFCR